MISAESVISIFSNIVMVSYVIGLISAFGISKCISLKRRLISVVTTVLMSAMVLSTNGSFAFAVYLVMVMTAFLIIFGDIRISYFYIFMISDSATSLLSSCIYVIINEFVPTAFFDFKAIVLLFLRLSLLTSAAVLNHSGKLKRLHFTIKIIPNHVFILIALSILFISVLAENNSFAVENVTKRILNALLIAALTISLTAIIFSLLISVISKKQVADTNLMLKNMVDAQLRHYKRLEKLNNDVRAFRHDYINHIRSISSLLEMKQYEDAAEYTGKLINASPAQNFSFQTGNNLADAILTDKNDFCGESAKIVFYGFIPDKIDNSDLCVILSNALDNAAEACANCAGGGAQSLIEVCAQERQGYFVLTVRNPTADQRTYSCIPDTGKPDALNHGFGLRNIEAVVKKHDGQLSVKCESNVFELSLTFKL